MTRPGVNALYTFCIEEAMFAEGSTDKAQGCTPQGKIADVTASSASGSHSSHTRHKECSYGLWLLA